MSRQRKACGVKRLTAATNILRLMQTFDIYKVSDLLFSLNTKYA